MMHHDRFEVNRPVYIIGMLALLGCLGAIMLAFLILPYLLWHLHYDVPEIVSHWEVWLHDEQGLSPFAVAWSIFGGLCGLAFILGCISYGSSRYIEKKLIDEE